MRKEVEEATGKGGRQGYKQRCMETMTAWKRNRLTQPHSWSYSKELSVATGYLGGWGGIS